MKWSPKYQLFKGFSPKLFGFLRGLAQNNRKDWFDEHRVEYQAEVLGPVKAFVSEIGPILRMLNEDLETEPRVGRTISRINNDIRFHKNRPRYRPVIYIGFPRRAGSWKTDALLYLGIRPHGVSIGFYPGDHREPRVGPVQEGIKHNLRLFQRYLDERRIAERYSELAGFEEGRPTKWPLPKTARRWVTLDSINVGEYFSHSDAILGQRSFLDRARQILFDLYPLWLFAQSENVKSDLELYSENIKLLARPIAEAAD